MKPLPYLLLCLSLGCATGVYETAEPAQAPRTDWPAYLGDKARSHYSSLDQIDRGNVARLEVAWTYARRSSGRGCRWSRRGWTWCRNPP
jgi:quinoprotein glucose dehydrogenase